MNVLLCGPCFFVAGLAMAQGQHLSNPTIESHANSAGDSKGREPIEVLELVRRAMERLESAMSAVSVKGTVECRVRTSVHYDPALSVAFEYRLAEDRVLLDCEGPDLENMVAHDGQRPAVGRFARLYAPGGRVETLDKTAGTFRVGRRSYREARYLHVFASPGECIWSFVGAPRTEILRRRRVSLVSLSGSAPVRVAVVRAEHVPSGHVCEFEFVEEWDWLPRRSSAFVWPDGAAAQTEVYAIHIYDVRRTRLGYFPARASRMERLVTRRTDGSASELYTEFTIAYERPQFTGVTVPETLTGDTKPDAKLGEASFLAPHNVWRRSAYLERSLAPMLPSVRGARQGVRSSRGRWVVWLNALGVGMLVGGLVLKRKWMMMASIATGLSLLAAGCLLRWDVRLWGKHETGSMVIVEGTTAPKTAGSLCGVDALYAAMQALGKSESYGLLLRLTQPGVSGVDLATLGRTAECLLVTPTVIDLADYAEPPIPTICHLPCSGLEDGHHVHEFGHFVSIIGSMAGEVFVFDPGRGITRRRWADLRRAASRTALWLSSGGRGS